MGSPLLFATILLDPPTAMLFGGLLALASYKRIRLAAKTAIFGSTLWGVWVGVFYGITVGWFFFHQPDWMWAYLRDTRDLPLGWAYAVFMLCLAAHGAVGALSVSTLLSFQRWLAALILVTVFALYLSALFFLQWDAYQHVGSFQEYHTQKALALEHVSTMKQALGLSGAVTALGLGSLLLWRVWKN